MSYILDALRRAQAERERGQVPGLEARTLAQAPPQPAPPQTSGLWLGGALALAGLTVAALVLWRGEGPPAPVAASGPAWAPAAGPAQAVARAGGPRAAVPTPTTPPPMVVVSAPVLPPARPPLQPAPGPKPVVPATPALLPLPASAQPVPPPSSVRAVQLAQLSPDLRRELPAMVLGGAIWSDNAASRFVIVNGQVLREGDAVAPGVVLERIAPKAVFMRWRDWRIEVPI